MTAGPLARSDALEQWLATRDALVTDADLLDRARAAPLVWAARDGHRKYIDDMDARRGMTRVQTMRAALRLTRERAVNRPALDIAALVAVASVALGARVELRIDAAHRGDDVYGTARLGELASSLAGIDDASVPLLVRACRVYLDVCFFHPLVDGNGRAARLAFDFVLARAHVRLDLVTPLFCVLRPAGDAEAHRSFVRLACTIADATARRLQTTHEERHA